MIPAGWPVLAFAAAALAAVAIAVLLVLCGCVVAARADKGPPVTVVRGFRRVRRPDCGGWTIVFDEPVDGVIEDFQLDDETGIAVLRTRRE